MFDCTHCCRSGAVIAERRDDGYKIAFRCSCELGEKLKATAAIWDPIRALEFKPLFYKFDEQDDSRPKKIWHRGHGPQPTRIDVGALKAGINLPYNQEERI